MEEQTAKSDVKDGQQNDIHQWSFMKKLKSTKGSDDHSKTNDVKSHELHDWACKSLFYCPVESDGCLTNEDTNDLENTVRSDGGEQPSRNSEDEHNASLSMQNGVTDDQTNDVPVKRSMMKKPKRTKGSAGNPKTDSVKSCELPNNTCQSVFYHPVESKELLTNVDKNDLDNTVRSDGEEQPRKHNVSLSMQSDVRDDEPHKVLMRRSVMKKPKSKKGSVNHPKTDFKSHGLSERASKSVFYHPVESERGLSNEDKNDLENTVRSDGEKNPAQSSEKKEHSAPLSMQSDVKDGQRSDISLLQSMLNKLENTNRSADRPKTDDVKSHACQGRACKGIFNPPVKTEGEICLTREYKNDLDGTIKPVDDAEQPNSQKEDENKAVEQVIGPPDEIPKWERRIFFPGFIESGEGKTLEVKNNNEDSMGEHMEEDALLLDSPSQQSPAQESHLSVSSDRADCAQVESKHEPLDEACGGPSTPVSEIHQTVRIRQIRSASDPVAHKPKEERPLSAPSVSNLQEYEKYTETMNLKSLGKAAMNLRWGNSDMTEHENTLAKTQKKGGRGMKYFTQKIMGKLKEKQYCEQTDSKGIQESGQEETQSLNSMQMEPETPEIPPPLPQKKGKYLVLNRNFTLKDFKLNLEPIDLMGEIFTGEEWLSYLPSKTSPDEKDVIEQSKAYDALQPKNALNLNHLQPILEQDQSEDTNDNQKNDSKLKDLQPIPEQDQSEDTNDNQESVNEDQLDNVAQVNTESHPESEESEAKFFAIPKALLTNNAMAQKALATDCDKSDDIYGCVDMYIIPKNDINRKSSDISALDFVTVKSYALLDNSALKSRIRVSKKRNHRPPKQHKIVKKEVSNAKFYSVPPTILNTSPVSACLPHPSIPCSTSPPLRSPPPL